MIPVGQRYKPTGQFEPIGTILAAAGCLILAAVAGGVVWLWEISPIPQLLVLTSILQGLGVGLGAYWLFRKVRLRNPFIATVIAFAGGAFSIGLVHYGLYLYFIHVFRNSVHQRYADDPDVDMAEVDRKLPSIIDDKVLYPKTGHRGFVGFMILRNQQGEQIGHAGTSGAPVTGAFLWGLWAVEALAVAGFAAGAGLKAAKEPFCEDCGQWFNKPRTTLWFAPNQLQAVTDAVNGGQPPQLETLKRQPAAASLDAGQGSVTTRVHECGKCGQTLADVVQRVPSGKKGQFKETCSVQHLAVSKEMATALKTVPPPAGVAGLTAASLAASPIPPAPMSS
jgi:hypothetical protein